MTDLGVTAGPGFVHTPGTASMETPTLPMKCNNGARGVNVNQLPTSVQTILRDVTSEVMARSRTTSSTKGALLRKLEKGYSKLLATVAYYKALLDIKNAGLPHRLTQRQLQDWLSTYAFLLLDSCFGLIV